MARFEPELTELLANKSGDGHAAFVLAVTALDAIMTFVVEKEPMLDRFDQTATVALNNLKPVDGDPQLSARAVEVARHRVDQALVLLRNRHLRS